MSNKFKTVKICDFGLVREMDSQLAQTVCGTQEYMCPEIFQKKPYGMPADVFSLGCIFYEMITLKFKQNHNAKLVMEKEKFYTRVKKEMCEEDDKFEPVADIVCAMLMEDPSKRISIEEAISKFEKLQSEL